MRLQSKKTNQSSRSEPGVGRPRERIVVLDVANPSSTGLRAGENLMAVLDDKLHGIVPRLHIRHLALDAVVTHDGRRENDGDILRRHQI